MISRMNPDSYPSPFRTSRTEQHIFCHQCYACHGSSGAPLARTLLLTTILRRPRPKRWPRGIWGSVLPSRTLTPSTTHTRTRATKAQASLKKTVQTTWGQVQRDTFANFGHGEGLPRSLGCQALSRASARVVVLLPWAQLKHLTSKARARIWLQHLRHTRVTNAAALHVYR